MGAVNVRNLRARFSAEQAFSRSWSQIGRSSWVDLTRRKADLRQTVAAHIPTFLWIMVTLTTWTCSGSRNTPRTLSLSNYLLFLHVPIEDNIRCQMNLILTVDSK